MKKIIVSLMMLVFFGIVNANVNFDRWNWDAATESVTVYVVADEFWDVSRSYDGYNWTKIASRRRHQDHFTDFGGTKNRIKVYYRVDSSPKRGPENPNNLSMSWTWQFMWERQGQPGPR